MMLNRLRPTLAALATLTLASNVLAGSILLSSPSTPVKTPATDLAHTGMPSVTETVVSLSVTGMMSCDPEGDVDNSVMMADLFALLGGPAPGPNEMILLTGIGWDLNQRSGLDSGAASWLSEMTFGFDYEGDGLNDLFLTPSVTNSPGSETTSSGGIVNLADNSLPNGLIPSGQLIIELFESYDDEPDVCEGIIDMGSLSFDMVRVPEPVTSPFFALIGLVAVCIRRRR